eukprot:360468-Chlamydomonas_euryale.AAC.7
MPYAPLPERAVPRRTPKRAMRDEVSPVSTPAQQKRSAACNRGAARRRIGRGVAGASSWHRRASSTANGRRAPSPPRPNSKSPCTRLRDEATHSVHAAGIAFREVPHRRHSKRALPSTRASLPRASRGCLTAGPCSRARSHLGAPKRLPAASAGGARGASAGAPLALG